MRSDRVVRRRTAGVLGVTGASLGVVAGAVQALAGARIPEWTGAKQAPGSLGLLTVVLSLLAGYMAYRQSRGGAGVSSRAGHAAAVLLPGLLCFSTVGRLWYLPGPLLLVAGILTIDGVREVAALAATNWLRWLLALLGAAELLMAAGAASVLSVVGGVGGVALIAAAAAARSRSSLLVLVLFGTVPFAALAWTAVVPVLLLFVAVAITASIPVHSSQPSSSSR